MDKDKEYLESSDEETDDDSIIDNDEKKILEFKEKSETYKSIHLYFSEPIREIVETKTAISIITEINDKHYKGI